MAVYGKLALSYPISLFILIVLQTTAALVLHGQPDSSTNTPQIIARSEQAAIVEAYTGQGPPPVAVIWSDLTTGLPLQYTPTASNITLRLTLKSHNVQGLSEKGIYSLPFVSLADIALTTASTHGLEYIRPGSQNNATFASSLLSPHIHFKVTATDDLPIYVVTDVLRAMQELTHYLYLLEMVFEVFSDTNPTSLPIASGCLAFDCGFQRGTMISRDLEHANFSATNLTAAPSRRLQSLPAPISLINPVEHDSVVVAYDHLMDPLSISDQSFADLADRILANITNFIIANQGDGPLPFYGNTQRRLFHYVDTWGSNFGISLLPMNIPGVDFTLVTAALALQATRDKIGLGSMMESRLEFTVDGRMVGWGCLRYHNTSAFRCIMPTGGTSSVGSQSISAAGDTIFDINTDE